MKDSHSSPSFSFSSLSSYLDDPLNSFAPPSSSSSSSSSPSTFSFPSMTHSPSSSPSYLDDLLNSHTSPYSSLLNPTPTPSSSSAMTDLLSSFSAPPPPFSFPPSPSTSNLLNSSSSSPNSSSLFNLPSSSSPPPSSSSSSSPFSFPSAPSYMDILNSSTSSLFSVTRPSFSYSPSNQNDSPPPHSTPSSSSSSSSIEKLLSSYYSSSPTDMLSSYVSSLNSTLTVPTISVDESQWKYDVFVSFRGEDTRNSFASHLFQALVQEGYTCFRDNDKQTRGMVIESKLLDAIRHSMVSLVLFSKNYADSRWCLNELVEILECHERWKEDGHLVLPIFYDVEPGEVRKQSGKFGEGFERCTKAKNWDPMQIDKWKCALQEAGNLSGWHLRNDSNGDEADFVRNIVSQLASMKLPAKRRKQLAIAQEKLKKVNALRAGFAQIDAIEAATPKRNMNELIQAMGKRNIAYVQLAGLIHNPDFVDKLLSQTSNQK